MAYYITEPLGGSDDVVVSVYKNTGEYVGNIIVDRYKWRMSSDEDRDDIIQKCLGDKKWSFCEIARFSQNQDKMQKNENLTVFEAVAADAVSYADAVLEDLDKKK